MTFYKCIFENKSGPKKILLQFYMMGTQKRILGARPIECKNLKIYFLGPFTRAGKVTPQLYHFRYIFHFLPGALHSAIRFILSLHCLYNNKEFVLVPCLLLMRADGS